MKRTLLAAAAIVLAVASPAFAQSYRDLGPRNPGTAAYASNRNNPIHSPALPGIHYNPYYDFYAQPPGTWHGHRSPYAQFDSNGRLIDENMPGRW